MDILQVEQEKKMLEQLIRVTSETIKTHRELVRVLDGIHTDRIFDEDREIPRLSYRGADQTRKHLAREEKELRDYQRRYVDILAEWKKFSPEEKGRIDIMWHNKEVGVMLRCKEDK